MRFKAAYIALVITMMFTILSGMSCKKMQVLSTGGTLLFSVDTLKFDTVFTAAGSFTTNLLIYNPQNEEVIISSVQLNEGVSSYFHLNVDGFPANGGTTVTNLRLAAHDSMYVFATVDINPNNKLTPFIVTDSLVVTMNGKNFYVPFTAYGQNARYIVDSVLAGTNITWDTTLPYVIINSAEVNTGSTLTINPGCRVYMHQNSGLVVLGTLLVNGTPNDTVIFQGDRLDRAYFGYQGYPGEWGGIYFDPGSTASRMSFTRLENCGNGALSNNPAAIIIYADSFNILNNTLNINTGAFSATPELTLDHCLIENSYGYGIYNMQGSLVASNCNINTTGQYALAVVQGGFDSIINCTFANYGNYAVTHANYGTVAILDYYWDGTVGDPTYYGGLSAVMRNCIVYGSLDSEVVCDATGTPFNTYTARLLFDHCLLKMDSSTLESFVTVDTCIINDDPSFKNSANGDFHLNSGSPAIGTGTLKYISFTGTANVDLDGNPRTNSGKIDIGCYEYQ